MRLSARGRQTVRLCPRVSLDPRAQLGDPATSRSPTLHQRQRSPQRVHPAGGSWQSLLVADHADVARLGVALRMQRQVGKRQRVRQRLAPLALGLLLLVRFVAARACDELLAAALRHEFGATMLLQLFQLKNRASALPETRRRQLAAEDAPQIRELQERLIDCSGNEILINSAKTLGWNVRYARTKT